MPVPVSYIFVIIIWSTSPLGIVWSTESMGPTLTVFLRMLIALILSFFVVLFTKVRIPWEVQAVKVYTYSALGMIGGMSLSYLAAKTVPSGVISIIFGLAPIISSILAQKVLDEPKLTNTKLLSLILSILGLFLVCSTQIQTFSIPPLGLFYVFMAVTFFSLSGVLIKSIKISIHPMATTFGSLVVVTPLLGVIWFVFGEPFTPSAWSIRSIYATLYLGVFGSLFGFLAYFHVLQKLQASTVALTTLITPTFAIGLGIFFNGESVNTNLLIGASIIILSLALFQFGHRIRFLNSNNT